MLSNILLTIPVAREMAALNVWVSGFWAIFMPLVASLPSMEHWDPRIINGTEATAENTRHQVSVRMKSREIIFGTGHICGGSLIAPTIVLSAAHCFYDDDEKVFNSAHDYFVVMGTLDRFEKNENTISYELTHILYPDFDRPTYRNDIALIFLDGTVPTANPAVSVIKLNRAVLANGTICQVTGWGLMETGIHAEVLMSLDVPIIDGQTCSTNYGDSNIVDGMICAGYMEGGMDACSGDSGGPMVHNGKLVGVVSFGDGCAKPGFPGVYADVRHYVGWIEKNMKSGANATSLSGFITLSGLLIIMSRLK